MGDGMLELRWIEFQKKCGHLQGVGSIDLSWSCITSKFNISEMQDAGQKLTDVPLFLRIASDGGKGLQDFLEIGSIIDTIDSCHSTLGKISKGIASFESHLLFHITRSSRDQLSIIIPRSNGSYVVEDVKVSFSFHLECDSSLLQEKIGNQSS